MRAALYARFSSDLQRAASIEDQFRNCRKRAATEGWTVVAEFADAAISGSDSSRPQYKAMIAAAGRREFDVLILDDLSRLTRDSVEQETTIRRMEFQGIRIVSTCDGYDSRSASRKIQRGVKGLMNEIFLDDLRQKVHRGLEGQALKRFWCGGKPYGYRLRPVTDPSRLDPYGQPANIGTMLVIDAVQAKIVREIFERYCAGDSCHAIAVELNRRGVPSAGSTWKRKTRRASGWMSSSVRVILRNPLYRGHQRWNASQFVRDPDSGKHLRRSRPKSEWVTHQIEELRIVTDETFQKANSRTRSLSPGDSRLKAGGKAKYMLSGLLRCEVCAAHYIIADKYSYACSSFLNGGTCSNTVRVNRTSLEDTILGPVRVDLKDRELVQRMAADMEREYAKRIQASEAQAKSAPDELKVIDTRLEKIRALAGLTEDERQILIEKAEAKRTEIQAAVEPQARPQTKIVAILPKAAAMYVKQIDEGLAGNPRAAAKSRLVLRDMLGPIVLSPGRDGSLWASYRFNPAALIRTAGTYGRGDRI